MAADGSNVRLVSDLLRGQPFARWSPDRSRLAFLSGPAGVGALYVVGAGGDDELMVSDRSIVAFDWIPDGTSLVVDSEGGGVSLLAAVENAQRAQLSPTGFGPRMAPDGRSVVYFDGTEETSDIYLLATGADFSAARLTDGNGHNVLPAWSPDGSRIAFISDRDGNSEIYVMNADGSGLVRLTNDPAPDEAFQWSPDSSRILYTSYRDGADPLSIGIGNAEVYVVDLATQKTMNLTVDDAWNGDPSWSPDGAWIVFTRRTDHGEIYIMRADGSDVRMLEGYATSEFNDCCATWG